MAKTIKEIKSIIDQIDSLEVLEQHECNNDDRKGVQKAITSRKKQLEKELTLIRNYEEMNLYENDILAQNSKAFICGIDEVGRGPLAGPVVACAVILNPGHRYLGLNDSKKVSAKNRAVLNQQLIDGVTDYAYGIATSAEIDGMNIYQATRLAMQRAIDQLKVQPTHLLIDAMTLDNEINQTSIIKGDAKSVSIAAASIMAKEYRDNYMKDIAKQYPGYDFENNVGYGTKAHLEGIAQNGVISEHRKTFEPIKSILQ